MSSLDYKHGTDSWLITSTSFNHTFHYERTIMRSEAFLSCRFTSVFFVFFFNK